MSDSRSTCIDDELPIFVTMRFSTVLLSCIALAFSAGHHFSARFAQFSYFSGLVGLALYFCLELVADQRSRNHRRSRCVCDERRLSRRLTIERTPVRSLSEVLSATAELGVEPAMDSQADLETYRGRQTQPTISV
jgi:hypothetical protein